MDAEKTKALQAWLQQGGPLLDSLITERTNLLTLAAQQRDMLTTELHSTQQANASLKAELQSVHASTYRRQTEFRHAEQAAASELLLASQRLSELRGLLREAGEQNGRLRVVVAARDKVVAGLKETMQAREGAEKRRVAVLEDVVGRVREEVLVERGRAERERRRAEKGERLVKGIFGRIRDSLPSGGEEVGVEVKGSDCSELVVTGVAGCSRKRGRVKEESGVVKVRRGLRERKAVSYKYPIHGDEDVTE